MLAVVLSLEIDIMLTQKLSLFLAAFAGGHAGAFAPRPLPPGFGITSTPLAPEAHPCTIKSRRFASTDEDGGSDILDRVTSAVKSAADAAKDKVVELAEKEGIESDLEGLSKTLNEKARAAMSDLKLSGTEEADFRKLVAAVEAKAKEAVAAASVVASSDEVAQLMEAGKVATASIQKRAEEMLESYSSNNLDIQSIQQQATEEIVTILKNREYGIADLFYLLRLCTSFGLGMNPAVMAVFPLNVLIQLYNFSLIQEGGRGVLSAVALEIDKRAKKVITIEMDKQAKAALFGDSDAEVGALFKKYLLDAIGESEYNFGDVTQNLLDAIKEKGGEDLGRAPAEELGLEPIAVDDEASSVEILDAELVKELENIDAKLETSAELDSL